jgi:hypothetical protein
MKFFHNFVCPIDVLFKRRNVLRNRLVLERERKSIKYKKLLVGE